MSPLEVYKTLMMAGQLGLRICFWAIAGAAVGNSVASVIMEEKGKEDGR